MKNDSIILIGMAGVGKSTVGRQLSIALDYRFFDLDIYIEKKCNQTIQDIIDEEGESAFAQKEKECMYEIQLQRTVVAPGGSIIYHPDLMAYLADHSLVIYLEDAFANISKRLADPSGRGIVGLKEKSLRQIFDERKERYAACADLTIDCRNKTPEQVTGEIIEWLRKIRLKESSRHEVVPLKVKRKLRLLFCRKFES